MSNSYLKYLKKKGLKISNKDFEKMNLPKEKKEIYDEIKYLLIN